MATHSSVLAWRIPWMEKPGRLPSMGSHGVGHDWSNLAAAALKAMVFPVVYGCESWTVNLTAEELMFLNCGGGEDSWESLGLQEDPTSPSWRRSILGVYWRDLCWSWNSNILATWCEEQTHGKRPWCWERLRAGGEGDAKWWDGWIASQTQWTWVWVNSGSWWWTGRFGCWGTWGHKELHMTEWLNWTVAIWVWLNWFRSLLWLILIHDHHCSVWGCVCITGIETYIILMLVEELLSFLMRRR